MEVSFKPIGVIYTPFNKKEGMPIQSIGAETVKGSIVLNNEYVNGLLNLDGFSHIILVYYFHQSEGYNLHVKPFLDDTEHGVFATRAPKRPNSIGISTVKLLGIENNKIYFEGADMLTETPLLDIKPYTTKFDVFEVTQEGWLTNKTFNLKIHNPTIVLINIKVSIMFKKAIVRKPCPEMVKGITSKDFGAPDFNLATKQHDAYVNALIQCGLEVDVLGFDNRFPDSTFVEDTALCTPKCAIITNPGAEARNGEKEIITESIRKYYSKVEKIGNPGTLDAGDVMMVGDHYYIGLSDRTNKAGAEQLIGILEKHGMTGSVVEMSTMLHLKTGLSYLENNNLLVCGEFIGRAEFAKYNCIEVDEDEAYAANSLWINNTVLVPAGYPKTLNKIKKLGYKTIELEMSEFRKLDGGLSCLSLRF